MPGCPRMWQQVLRRPSRSFVVKHPPCQLPGFAPAPKRKVGPSPAFPLRLRACILQTYSVMATACIQATIVPLPAA